MEAALAVLSYLLLSLLIGLVPSSILGVWIHNCKSFTSLEKTDKMYMLLCLWLIFAMVAFLYIYAHLDTVNNFITLL